MPLTNIVYSNCSVLILHSISNPFKSAFHFIQPQYSGLFGHPTPSARFKSLPQFCRSLCCFGCDEFQSSRLFHVCEHPSGLLPHAPQSFASFCSRKTCAHYGSALLRVRSLTLTPLYAKSIYVRSTPPEFLTFAPQ